MSCSTVVDNNIATVAKAVKANILATHSKKQIKIIKRKKQIWYDFELKTGAHEKWHVEPCFEKKGVAALLNGFA